MVERIVSGGQTGADRGGLDAAIKLGIAHGGWCPKGRRAEDGKVPARYKLREAVSSAYHVRTKKNVLDADGTVIFTRGSLEGGSLLTARYALEAGKPWHHVDLTEIGVHPAASGARLRGWLIDHAIRVLNVAGSRESKAPGIRKTVAVFLEAALRREPVYAPEEERVFVDKPELAAAEDASSYGPRRGPGRRRSRSVH